MHSWQINYFSITHLQILHLLIIDCFANTNAITALCLLSRLLPADAAVSKPRCQYQLWILNGKYSRFWLVGTWGKMGAWCCTIIFSNELDYMKSRHLIGLILSLCTVAAHSETINFYAAAGVKVPAEEIITAFERQTGHTVARLYDTAGAAEEKFVAAGKTGVLQGVLITTEVRINKASTTNTGAL